MINNHWRPFIVNAKYCTIPYTVIGRLETMEQDLHYISKMAGLEFKKGVRRQSSSGGSTTELARKYFMKLDSNVVRQLYQCYEVDFEMFGYSVESFIAD